MKKPFKGSRIFMLVLAACMVLAGPETHAAGLAHEYEIKAAFLLNFAKFVEWPAQAFANDQSPVVIGILGENPFGDFLEDAVRNQNLGGRAIVIAFSTSPEELKKCHLLFISRSEQQAAPAVLKEFRKAVLTVGDMDDFIENGGIIRFIEKDKKIRFQINESAAREANIKISSRLLSLAVRS